MDFDEFETLEDARLQLEASKKAADDQKLICECMCLSLHEIRDFLKNGDINLEDLSKELGLGTGCSSCLKNFEQWKDQV